MSVPKELCDQLNLQPGTRIVWEIQEGKLIGYPLPREGWRALVGKRKRGPNLTAQLLAQRRRDRAHEDRKLAR